MIERWRTGVVSRGGRGRGAEVLERLIRGEGGGGKEQRGG